MKIEIEVKAPIGATVYEIVGDSENIYKICKTCGGTMRVLAKLGDREIDIRCPDCFSKSTAIPKHIRTTYSLVKRVTNSILIRRERTLIGLSSSVTDKEIGNDDIDSGQFITRSDGKIAKYYLSEEAAKAESERLNKEDQDKFDAFVSDYKSAYKHSYRNF